MVKYIVYAMDSDSSFWYLWSLSQMFTLNIHTYSGGTKMPELQKNFSSLVQILLPYSDK